MALSVCNLSEDPESGERDQIYGLLHRLEAAVKERKVKV
jgi:hypothetical protein